jgi:hypothetical protein
MAQKQCYKCKELKPLRAFSRNKIKPDGLDIYCKACHNAYIKRRFPNLPEIQRTYREKIRDQCLGHYSNWSFKCSCCGEQEKTFLVLDHVNNGGTQHRISIGGGGLNMFLWIKRKGFPDGFQVLCQNCNWGKHKLGSCPHVNAAREALKQ